MEKIVTRESLQKMIDTADEVKRQQIIGRALIAIFQRQTEEEQYSNDTKEDNTIGFSGADAKAGSITAKYFMKNGMLLDWQVEKWLKRGKSGYARITKYHRQLNEIAVAKMAKTKENQYRQMSNGG